MLRRGVHAGPLFDIVKHSLLLSNGSEHRRRRAPLARSFGVKLVAELRPRIRAIAEELIDECVARGGMSLVADYCALVPARVIAEILGLPAADIPEFTRHAYSLTSLLTPSFSSEIVAELQDSARQLLSYADDLANQRSWQPQNDFLTSYLQTATEPGGPSRLDALTQIVTLILAGSDTTRTALAIQVSLLLQHREQWQAVCADPALIPGAVSESLRYEPAVGSFLRFTLEDVSIDGYVVPRDRTLRLSTLSALRDPAVCADPDRFDIRRTNTPRRHPVFGGGAHRCLGEALARVELEEGLAALAARLPGLELVGEPAAVYGSGGIRTIQELHLRGGGNTWRMSVG